MVEMTETLMPGHLPNLEGLQEMYIKKRIWNAAKRELIDLNDCFYRNLYQYKYFALFDIDEVIMPLKSK